MSSRVLSGLCLAAVVFTAGCKRPEIPDTLNVRVEIDGQAAPHITAQRLRELSPSFTSGNHRAWKLDALIGKAFNEEDRVLMVERGDGTRSAYPRSAKAPVPVLALNRKGDASVVLMRSDAPFPAFLEGQKPPGVQRLKLYKKGGERAFLTLFKPGEEPLGLSVEEVQAIPTIPTEGDADDPRPAWPVREVIKHYAGAGLLTAAKSASGETLAIKSEDAVDPKKIPVLRINRRGENKLYWVTHTGERLEDLSALKGVSELHLRLP
ncbi:MAG: hypothetical protein ACT4TC_08050 [Myxococcaceae bacterium]